MAESTINHIMRGWDLLWTNSAPTSSSGFAAQDVMLDLSRYSWVLIAFRLSDSNDHGQYLEIPIDHTGTSTLSAVINIFNTPFFTSGNTGTPYVYSRLCQAFNDRVTFTIGYRKITSGSTASTTYTTVVVPVQIWAR